MKYCNDYHQLRKLPSGLLTCEHDLINNFYADRYKEKLAVLYEVAKNDSSIVANSSSQEQCWTMGNGIDLKLLKLTKGDIDRTGVFVVLKYKGKNIYPFENAFLFKNSLHAYRMGAIYNPQSYDNIAKFHNELYQNGENAALEQFNTEAKLFQKGLKWFVNTDQCKDKWIIRGTTLSYNKYEQLRTKVSHT